MVSFQHNQKSLHLSLLHEIHSRPNSQLSTFQYVYCDDEPIPLNCTTNVSLSLEPLMYSTNPPSGCNCHFLPSESLKSTVANDRNEPSMIRALAKNYSNDFSVNEVLSSTPTFDCPPNIGPSRSGLIAASFTCGPAVHDVVCSRGKAFYNLPGNVRFRKTIRSCIPMYLTASSKMDKSIIIDRIIDMTVIVDTINGSTRFLKYHSLTRSWSVMGYDQVRDKVGHALREAAYDIERENKIQSVRIPKGMARW